MKVAILGIFVTTLFVILFLAPNSTSYSQTSYDLSVNSAYGQTFGSGSYPNGTSASFGVSSTVVYDSAGTIRYVFSGWTCSGTGCYSGPDSSASVIMNDNIVETASWVAQYLLSTTITGNGIVNPSGEGWYAVGSAVPVSESTQTAGWYFAYWSLDGQNVGSSQSYTVSMDSPHDLVANFVKPEIESRLSNVSNAYGNNLRNPDGTFYRLDEFAIQYDALIVGGSPFPSSVSFIFNVAYPQAALNEISSGSGYAVFVVLPGARFSPYNIIVSASIFNAADNSNRILPINNQEPFAVVNYFPHFAYLTYMDYNFLNSPSYERPFITLVRYDGNSPGYSYSGDANTDPFNALNSTAERAIVNSFYFSTSGWSISTNLSLVNESASVINFLPHPRLDLTVSNLNRASGPTVITWGNRVEKFYFLSDLQQIKSYINADSIVYFNVTVVASYKYSYHLNSYVTEDFTTSYLYQPIFYDGYLIFKPYNNASNFEMTIISNNPSPLDAHLLSKASYIFGNDSQVINSMEKDLYPAKTTTPIKPMILNSTEWVYLINQTNFGSQTQDGIPYYTVSLSANSGYTEYKYQPNDPPYYLSSPATYYSGMTKNITYHFYDYYTLFGLSDIISLSLTNLTGYNLIQPSTGENLVLQPLNFSFTSSIAYLLRTYDNSTAPFFVTYEPGSLTQSFPMVYGENKTTSIVPNFAGGGLTGLDGIPVPIDGGTSYEVSLLIGNGSGGASRIWVVSDRGEVLYNLSLPVSSLSDSYLGPSGEVGQVTIQFPVGNTNHSVAIYLENAWGGTNVIDGVVLAPQHPPLPNYQPTFIAGILLVTFMISAGYSFFARRAKMNSG